MTASALKPGKSRMDNLNRQKIGNLTDADAARVSPY
jgi:hypothetical protein